MLYSFCTLSLSLVGTASLASALPLNLSNPDVGPIPSESSYYSNYNGTSAPFPANITSAILPTASGTPGPDDLLFQNLLSAEWAIYSFYQQGVEAFNASSFTALGLPNTTYERLTSIRDNEAGHLRIFQDEISSTSVKPGACKYQFGFTNAESYLATQVFLEIASMAFLTGLVQQAQLNISKGALVAIAETETRHEAWSLIDIWNTDPFAGPSDTSFPYANQILYSTNAFVVPGSCPSENPVYPSPKLDLPLLAYNASYANFTGGPGSPIEFEYQTTSLEAISPSTIFQADKDYWVVWYHGIQSISVPFQPLKTNVTTVPVVFEDAGLFIAVIADEKGAPTEGSVVAGPLLLLEQPEALTKLVP